MNNLQLKLIRVDPVNKGLLAVLLITIELVITCICFAATVILTSIILFKIMGTLNLLINHKFIYRMLYLIIVLGFMYPTYQVVVDFIYEFRERKQFKKALLSELNRKQWKNDNLEPIPRNLDCILFAKLYGVITNKEAHLKVLDFINYVDKLYYIEFITLMELREELNLSQSEIKIIQQKFLNCVEITFTSKELEFLKNSSYINNEDAIFLYERSHEYLSPDDFMKTNFKFMFFGCIISIALCLCDVLTIYFR